MDEDPLTEDFQLGITRPVEQTGEEQRAKLEGAEVRFSAWRAFSVGWKKQLHRQARESNELTLIQSGGFDIVDPFRLKPEYHDQTPILAKDAEEEFGLSNADRDMTRGEAAYVRDKQLEKAQDRVISSRSSGVAQFLGAMADPSVMFMGGVLGAGIKAGSAAIAANSVIKAKSIINTARLLSTGLEKGAMKKGIGALAARGGLEGILETALTTPMIAHKEQQLGQKYSTGDQMVDLAGNVLGSIMGEGLSMGFGKLLKRGDTALVAKHIESADNFSKEGRAYKPEILEDIQHADIHRPRVDGTPERPFAHIPVEQIGETKFHASFKGNAVAAKLEVTKSNAIDTSFGEGLVVTDNLKIAKNVTSRTLDTSSGQVAEIDVTGLKFLDLEEPPSKELRGELFEVIEQLDGKEAADALMADADIKTVLRTIDAEAHGKLDYSKQEAVNEFFKKKGYDGYKFVGGQKGGEVKANFEHQHNSLQIFDPKKVKVKNVQKVPIDTTTDKPFKAIEDHLNSKESIPAYDAKVKEMKPLTEEPTKEIAEITAKIETLKEELKYNTEDMLKGNFPEKLKGEVEKALAIEVKQLDNELKALSPEKVREITKAVDHCLRNG